MPCDTNGNLTICRGPQMEITRDESIGEKWCFTCRARRDFRYRYYAATREAVKADIYAALSCRPAIECGTCGTTDGDIGFGGSREWDC